MIIRTRLLNRITETPGATWTVEAGVGSGKTVLLSQLEHTPGLSVVALRSTHERTSVTALLTELASRSGCSASKIEEVLAAGDPVAAGLAVLAELDVLIIDDIDQWDDDAIGIVCQIAEVAPESLTVVLAARALPMRVQTLRVQTLRVDASALRFSDLAFDADDAQQALASQGVDAGLSATMNDLCDGLPAVISKFESLLRSGTSISQVLATQARIVDGLLHATFRGVDEADLLVAKVCAHLSHFDTEIAELIGSPGVLDRLKSAGVHVETGDDGWSRIPRFIRSSLTRSHPDPFKIPTAVIEHLVSRGECVTAISSCLTVGDRSGAAELVASLGPSQQTQLEPSTLGAAMTTIGEIAELVPRSLLVQAQVNASFGQIDEGAACLERAMQSVEQNDPRLTTIESLEIVLEKSLWQILQADPAGAQQTLDRCLGCISASSPVMLHGRVHDIQGLIAHTGGSREDLETAVVEKLKALSIWRQLAEPRLAAVTALRLVGGPLSALGRRSEAFQLLEDLPSVGPMTLVHEARVMLWKATLLPYLGRVAEVPAQLVELRRIAAVLGHSWLVSWALRIEIVAASFEVGAETRVLRLVDQFVAEKHFVLDDFAQFMTWREIAEALARCDSASGAYVALDNAKQIGGPPVLIDVTSVSVEARFGDPEAALGKIAELQASDTVEIGRRWLLHLLAALCHRRLDDTAAAQSSLQSCWDVAPRDGQLSLPRIVEPRIVELLESSEPSAHDFATQSAVINVFGEYSVAINGVPQPTPKSNATTLLKLLVLAGGQIVIDQAIDPLWPDTDLDVGRRRLRNVVARIRSSYGQIIEREGDLVKLAPRVSSDLMQARSIAAEVLRPGSSADKIDFAIAQNDQVLLPENRYDDWAEEARTEHQQLVLRLLDQRARVAEQANDIEAAVRALQRANDIAPPGSGRLETAAALLRGVGREAAATALLRSRF